MERSLHGHGGLWQALGNLISSSVDAGNRTGKRNDAPRPMVTRDEAGIRHGIGLALFD